MELISENTLWEGNYKDLKNMIADFHKNSDNVWIDKMMKIQHDFLEEIGLDDSYMVPILINNRLFRATGVFYPYGECIEISGRLVALTGIFNNEGYGILADTIKHEMIHNILHKQKLPYDDGQEDFENMCKKYHVSSSSESKYRINKTDIPMLRIIQWYEGKTNGVNYPVCDQLTPNEDKYVDVRYTHTEVVSQLIGV